MKISVSFRDVLGRDLDSMTRGLRNLAPLADEIGVHIVGIAKRSFNDTALRQTTWPPKKKANGQRLLKYTGNLWHSLRVINVTSSSVTVGSDRPYAAIHQLGGTIRRPEMRAAPGKAFFWPGAKHPVKKVKATTIEMPARPYFPFTPGGQLASFASSSIELAARAKLRALFNLPA
jgi:phage gpG-like protein